MIQMLSSKAIVVTGAGRGLGRAYALEIARNGASVIVNDVISQNAAAVVDEIRSTGGQAEMHVGSVADWDATGAMIDLSVTAFGRLDGLVNNAGLGYPGGPLDWDPVTLRELVEVNLLGTMYCGMRAMRAMAAQRSGAIVNVSSGSQLGMMDITAYGATKGGVTSLTYGWALEGRKLGIRVNAISPIAETPMALAWNHPDSATIIHRARDMDAQTDQAPVSKAEGVAPLVAALLSDATAAITGQCLRFDGQTVSILQTGHYEDGKQKQRDSWSAQQLADVLNGDLKDALCDVGAYPPRLEVPMP